MIKKLCLIMGFLLVFTISFIQGASSPSFFNSTASVGDNTLSTGIWLNEKSPPTEKTQEQRDCEKNGCFEEGHCYPYGYIKEKRYCNEKGKKYGLTIYRPGFINQSEIGKGCNNSYECETGLCYKNICIDLTEQINYQVNIKSEELKSNLSYIIDKPLANLTESKNISLNIEQKEASVEKGFFKKFLNWFKKIYS